MLMLDGRLLTLAQPSLIVLQQESGIFLVLSLVWYQTLSNQSATTSEPQHLNCFKN